MQIEQDVATEFINIVGDVTKNSFQGTFRFKCFLTPLEEIKADRLFRELIGTSNSILTSDRVRNLSLALGQLKFRILESPAGWKHEEVDGSHLDYNIIITVFNLAMTAEETYRKQKKEEYENLQKRLTTDVKKGKIKPQPKIEDQPLVNKADE